MEGFFACQAPRLAKWMYQNLNPCGETLDIGCGTKWYYKYIKPDGLISVDVWKATEPDILLDVSKNPLPFPDLHFDTVLMLDIIEHMERDEGWSLLDEAYRVCKKKLVLVTPIYWNDNGEAVRNHPEKVHRGNPFNYHKSLWQPEDFGHEWRRVHGVFHKKRYYFGVWERK
jgi:SAM-dependent methyltransferase